MAHFAKLNENNIVLEVLVVKNEIILDENNNENEQKGIDFLKNITGHEKWKQTSYNNNFRKNYAGVGYSYDQTRDAFIPPKPFNSWLLNETTCQWESPVAMPQDGNKYTWNEQTLSWDLVEDTI